MKVVLLVLTVVALCASQTVSGCAGITARDLCSNTAGRCQWLVGRNCNGNDFAFCTDNVACGDVIICARRIAATTPNTNPVFTFLSTCLPLNWERVDPSLCACAPPNNTATCSPACTSCQSCVGGVCVDNPTVSQCGPQRPCPNGMRCDSTTRPCTSVCVPACASTIVQCLVDPCRQTPPPNCPTEAVCVADYCGGCNRKYYDRAGTEICQLPCLDSECGPRPALPTIQCPDGSTGGLTGVCRRAPGSAQCSWEIRECPYICNDTLRTCPNLYCPYGYEYDIVELTATYRVRCPACRCYTPPTDPCAGRTCPQVTCALGSQPYVPTGTCCPVCPNPCDSVRCPEVVCPAGYAYRVPQGECCGRCFPVFDCSTVTCALPPSPCPTGTTLVLRECCRVCQPVIPCADVRCQNPNSTCPDGFKIVFRDGECCPRCEPRSTCDGVTCPTVTCPTGTTATIPDLRCCPECRPTDYCATVLCARPNCSVDQQIKRAGSCCPQCPTCRDETGKVCDTNDDTDCRAGFFRGPNCQDPVPPTERKFREIIVRLCKRPDCTSLDPQTIRIILAALANIDSKYISVEVLGQSDEDRCCYRYKITIATENSDPTDVDATAQVVTNSISANSAAGWTVESGTTTGSSASIISATCFAAVAAALL